MSLNLMHNAESEGVNYNASILQHITLIGFVTIFQKC